MMLRLHAIVIAAALSLLPCLVNAQTAVEKYGQLSVKGNRIVDKNGNPVQLQGMSLYWSMWKPAFYNETTLKWLRDDWCITVIRAAIGIDAGGGGYKNDPTAEMNRITTVVDAAIKLGIYVIVDFHDHTASDKLPTAQKFFQDVSTKYKNVPNIIYETWNEPLAVSWSSVIKPYHEKVIATIRANDPDNIIICGTANWSQKVGDPKTDPIKGTNIAYTLHYYADSHKQWLRDAASAAMSGTNGIALFVTEYGTCAADGSGAINETESNAWYQFMADNSIGHCNWSVANLGETSAIIPTAVTALANWPVSSLKPSGAFVRNYLKSRCNTTIPVHPTPTVTLTAPANNSGTCVGTAITINATAAVSSGTINKVDFYDGTTLLGSDNSAPYSHTWNSPAVGTHTLRAISTSAANVASLPATTFITVNANPQVTITSPSNNATVSASPISLGATVTGTGIANVQFYNGTTLLGQKTASPYTHSWANTVNGNYTINVKATSANNCTSSASVKMTLSLVTGLEDSKSFTEISCFPNPFSHSFTVKAENNFHYTLYDIEGVEMEKGSAENSVSLGQNLPFGMYMVKIQNSSKSKTLKVSKF